MPNSSLSGACCCFPARESQRRLLLGRGHGWSCWGCPPAHCGCTHTMGCAGSEISSCGQARGDCCSLGHLVVCPSPWSTAGCQGQGGWVDPGLPATLLLAEQCFMQNHSIDNM